MIKNFRFIENFFNDINFKDYLLFFLISSHWALLIKENLISENSVVSVNFLYLYIYFIFIFQIFIIYFINKFAKNYNLLILALVLFLFYNFYSLSISLTSNFILLVKFAKVKWFLIYFFFSFLTFQLIFRLNKAKKIIIYIYIFLNIFSFLNISNFIKSNINKETSLEFNLADKIIEKDFNIYVFSLESFIPESIAYKHFGLDNLKYFETLKEYNFTLFKNNFGDNHPTKPSLNSLVYFDSNKWRQAKNRYNFFAGRNDTELFKFFRNNDYRIITAYFHSIFGPPGKYVDEHYNFRSIDSNNKKFSYIYINFCNNKLPWYHLQLFNYCDLINNLFNITDENLFKSEQDFQLNLVDKLINKNKKAVFFHFTTYGHPDPTTTSYLDDIKNSDKDTVQLINKMAKNIIENDPNSILLLIGDHGPSILKTSKEIELRENIIKNYKNFKHAEIIDTYATIGAILDYNNLCSKQISDLEDQQFTTNSKILSKLVSCYFNQVEDFEKNLNTLKYLLPNNESYVDYLYE